MDIEPRENFDETNVIFQSDNVPYEDAYQLNKFKLVDIAELVTVIANVLSDIIKETDNVPDQFISSFHAKSVPSINIKDYMLRIAKCSKCSQECFILALIYIDRLTERTKNFLIKSLNIHRLLITGVMLAAKFFDDNYFNNEYFARIGGISNKEINVLEVEFLNYINFNLYVDPILFLKYRQRLLCQAQSG